MEPTNTDALLSVNEAAKRLGGISKWTIHAWLSQGKIQRTKVVGRTMIRESELAKVIRDGGKSPGPRPAGNKRKQRGILVTVMIPRFFGMPQEVVRLGIWAEHKPTEAKVYAVLWHESECYRARELSRTDGELRKLAGVSPRALRDARIKLQERGLVCFSGKLGDPYVYTLCDPATKQPWLGDPKKPIPYRKKDTTTTGLPKSPVGSPKSAAQPSSTSDTQPLENYGVPLKF